MIGRCALEKGKVNHLDKVFDWKLTPKCPWCASEQWEQVMDDPDAIAIYTCGACGRRFQLEISTVTEYRATPIEKTEGIGAHDG